MNSFFLVMDVFDRFWRILITYLTYKNETDFAGVFLDPQLSIWVFWQLYLLHNKGLAFDSWEIINFDIYTCQIGENSVFCYLTAVPMIINLLGKKNDSSPIIMATTATITASVLVSVVLLPVMLTTAAIAAVIAPGRLTIRVSVRRRRILTSQIRIFAT